ncbi:hypothetical protein F5Y01DRAFT_329498 [Xylaria sp. FL0043]|nr:hypothetical protein F5Y01DRAFT_329498 [Xylaria sp. FL0043]
MFGSWRVNHSGHENTTFRHSPMGRKACKNCRARKVKCTGELSGCQRCDTLGIECVYTNGPSKPRRRPGTTKKSFKIPTNNEDLAATQQDLPGSIPRQPTQDSTTGVSELYFDGGIGFDNGLSGASIDDVQQWSPFSTYTPDGYLRPSDTSSAADLRFWGDATASHLGESGKTLTAHARTESGDGTSRNLSYVNTSTSSFQLQTLPNPSKTTFQHIPNRSPLRNSAAWLRETPEQEHQQPCNCLERIVLLINELEANAGDMDMNYDHDDGDHHMAKGKEATLYKRRLDSTVGLYKEALRYGESMRQCGSCSFRAETPSMLLLLSNRLVMLGTDMVSDYHSIRRPSQTGSVQRAVDMIITIGDYEVESTAERRAILRELISFQLRDLHGFIGALSENQQRQVADFVAVKGRVTKLLYSLQTNEQ